MRGIPQGPAGREERPPRARHAAQRLLLLALCLGPERLEVLALENVDPVNDGSQHAYAENVGWINTEPLGEGGPGVLVGDGGLTGFLWSENVGWVSLSCANTASCGTISYGVANDGSGVLSGYAWGENVGWINFAPTDGGVAIDPAMGVFSGRAWGENIGWITFGSTGPVPYQVRTSWPVGSLQLNSGAFSVAEGGGPASITVTRAGGSRGAVGASVSTGDGTAVSPDDYASTSGAVSFADGDTVPKVVDVPIVNDDLAEGDETVNLTLGAPTGGVFLGAPGAAVLTILDNPGTLQFSSATYSAAEGGGPAIISVTRIGGSGGTVEVGFATSDGSATAPQDYAATAGSISFAPGEVASKSFGVPIVFDLIVEPDETVNIALSGPTGGATLGSPGAAVLTIVDPNLPGNENVDPTEDGSQFAYGENVGWINAEPSGAGGDGVRVGDAALAGHLWSENVGWVSLSCANTGTCGTVGYGVANDGNGVLSGYAWGENVGWINFSPSGGGVIIDPATGVFGGRAWGENIGWITFGSTGPVPYKVRTSWPVGTLQFSAAGYSIAESGGAANVTVTREGGKRGAIGATFSTSDGSATAPDDYTVISVTVSFADGDSSPRALGIPILNDALAEGDESVGLNLGSPTGGGFLGSPTASVLTILDNPGSLAFGSPSYSAAETAGAAAITITRTGGAGGTVGIGFTTIDGSAAAPDDYVPASGSFTFGPGDTAPRSLSVPIVFDLLQEGDETLSLSLGSPTGGAVVGNPGAAVLTILDRPVPAQENVDPAQDGSQYAYGENVGWLNAEPLGPGGPGLRVGERALAGYLWSENVGWISLSCANTASCAAAAYGVANDGAGILSGYAWGENVGWINFAPVGAGVTIDPITGTFGGRAWGENIGWITFGSTGPVLFQVRAGCPDVDGDGVPLQSFLCPAGGQQDCNDGDGQIWGTPGEVRDLLLPAGGQTLAWTAPALLGGTSVRYDTIRSSSRADFVVAGICVESDDASDTMATDVATPALGGAFYYLIRAENSCPSGQGPLGLRSDGTPRTALNCP